MSAATTGPAMIPASAAAVAKSSFLIGHSPSAGRARLHGKPGMKEQRVVVVGADRGAVEFVVIGVLQADAGIEPRPAHRLAEPERDVGDLGRPAVAVRGQGASGDRVDAVYGCIGGTPDIETLTGEYAPVVAAIGKRALQLQGIEQVGRISRSKIGKARIQSLKL